MFNTNVGNKIQAEVFQICVGVCGLDRQGVQSVRGTGHIREVKWMRTENFLGNIGIFYTWFTLFPAVKVSAQVAQSQCCHFVMCEFSSAPAGCYQG